MTAHKTVRIQCDGTVKQRRCWESVETMRATVIAARNDATKLGWTHVNGQDFCNLFRHDGEDPKYEHDFNQCRCNQVGRCLVHCPTCACGK